MMYVKHRPRIRLTIRQRTRVLQEWPMLGTSMSYRTPPRPGGRGSR
jgi:hypothetical protein